MWCASACAIDAESPLCIICCCAVCCAMCCCSCFSAYGLAVDAARETYSV